MLLSAAVSLDGALDDRSPRRLILSGPEDLDAVEAMLVDDGNGSRIPVTASVGLASLQRDEDVDQLMDRADRAMYAAKYGGRNRVGVDDPHSSPHVLSNPPQARISVPPVPIVTGTDPTHLS